MERRAAGCGTAVQKILAGTAVGAAVARQPRRRLGAPGPAPPAARRLGPAVLPVHCQSVSLSHVTSRRRCRNNTNTRSACIIPAQRLSVRVQAPSSDGAPAQSLTRTGWRRQSGSGQSGNNPYVTLHSQRSFALLCITCETHAALALPCVSSGWAGQGERPEHRSLGPTSSCRISLFSL